MVAAVYPSRAAERVILRELFRNAADVHRNGGVISGNPVFARDGMVMDGTGDFVTYKNPGRFGRGDFAARIVFTPDFDPDDGNDRTFFGYDVGGHGFIRKTAANQLRFDWDTTKFATALSSWLSLWKVGEKNSLIVSANNAWLNGVSFTSAAGSLVAIPGIPEIVIGARYDGSLPFVGTYHELSIYDLLLTDLDVQAIESDSLFSYSSKSSVYLDMATATARAGTIRGTTEELVNGDFSAWTPAGAYEDPDGWTVPVGTAAVHIEEDPAGHMHMVSDGTYITITQPALEVGRRYRCIVVVSAVTSGGITVTCGVTLRSFLSPGTYDFTFVAANALIGFKRYLGATDVSVDSISVVETDELLSDSDMEVTGTGEWLVGASAVLTKENGLLRIAYGGGVNPGAYQAIVTASLKYHIAGRARSDGTWKPVIQNPNGTTIWEGTISTDWQYFSLEFTAGGGSVFLESNATGAGYVEFDYVKVRPVLSRTLDRSSHGRVCLLGDGVTAAPAFQNPGFLFDAATDYLTLPPDPTGTFTVAWKRENGPTVFESNLTTWNLLNAAGGFEGHLDYLAYWDFELSPIQEDDLDLLWRGNR